MIQTIKLSQLVPPKRDVRRRSDAAVDAQLRADIEARGLLQNLILRAGRFVHARSHGLRSESVIGRVGNWVHAGRVVGPQSAHGEESRGLA